jgi:cell division protein FtsW (lipid II flippase)
MAAGYLFLFYIGYFLWQGLVYIYHERADRRPRDRNPRLRRAKLAQRYAVALTHTLGFTVISLSSGLTGGGADYQTLIAGGVSLVFLIAAFALFDLAYRGGCPLMVNGALFLTDIGFIMLYRLNRDLAARQMLFAGAGVAVTLLIPFALTIIRRVERLKYLYLLAGIGLLSLPFFLGAKQYGARSWIIIERIGMSFQPSEFVKVAFVMYAAAALQKSPGPIRALPHCAAAAAFVAILALQNDFGGALIYFITFMVMLYAATGSLTLFALGFGGASGAVWAIFTFAPSVAAHVLGRVSAWIDPWADPADAGYQLTQSLFALGTWGLFGSGLTRGVPNKIPVVERDMIFSGIAEEFGPLFACAVVAIYIMIVYRAANAALRTREPFRALTAVGLSSLLALQTFVTIGGATRLIPLTGITLPFVSYGGSSIFVCFIMIGILDWIRLSDGERDRAAAEAAISAQPEISGDSSDSVKGDSRLKPRESVKEATGYDGENTDRESESGET